MKKIALVKAVVLVVLMWMYLPFLILRQQKTVDLNQFDDGKHYMYIMNEDNPFEKHDTIIYRVMDEKGNYVLLMDIDNCRYSTERKEWLKNYYLIK